MYRTSVDTSVRPAWRASSWCRCGRCRCSNAIRAIEITSRMRACARRAGAFW
ncbi:hypothetical protein ACU4HD_43975 [Cupriavidus basilensis]